MDQELERWHPTPVRLPELEADLLTSPLFLGGFRNGRVKTGKEKVSSKVRQASGRRKNGPTPLKGPGYQWSNKLDMRP